MHPYRTPPPEPPECERVESDVADDRVLGGLLLLIGGVRVSIALANHEVFAAESTIALFMVAMAASLLLRRR